MIKNYYDWLNESKNDEFLASDHWGPIDEQILDYFDEDVNSVVSLGIPGIGWMSDSQPFLHRLIVKMIHNGTLEYDSKEEAKTPWFRKTGVSEGGKKIYYFFFDKPFKVVIASINEQRWKTNNMADRKSHIGQIYILKSTANDLIHEYRGRIQSPKYGL